MASVHFERVSKRFHDGTKAVDALDLTIEDGEFMVFVGPSGCGKTTALRMVAGLEQISDGRLLIDGELMNDTDCGERDIAMVFQNYALYPHMTVEQNLDFPLKLAGLKMEERRRRIDQTIRMLGLQPYLKRKPASLSGGQRQRVAMGRALVRQPRVFLMDEPLSNLDAKLRGQMRSEIATLQKTLGITTIYVTHDQIEALTMGDRVAVMREGVLQQVADPDSLYVHPANLFVAAFVGSPSMNLVMARVEPAPDGAAILALGDQKIGLTRHEMPPEGFSGPVVAGLRPEAFLAGPTAEERTLAGTIAARESVGSDLFVRFTLAGCESLPARVMELANLHDDAEGHDAITRERCVTALARLPPALGLSAGEPISLGVTADSIRLFDPVTGKTLQPQQKEGRT